MSIPAKVKNHLEKNRLKFEILKHKTVYTAYDLAQTSKTKLQEIAKTLLVKADKNYYLVVMPAHLRLSFKKLKKRLRVKKVSMAPEKEMSTKLKVKPGAITPFGTLYKIGVVLDKSLTKIEWALFGAGSFTESLRLKLKDYIKLEDPQTGDVSEKTNLKLQVKTKKKPGSSRSGRKTQKRGKKKTRQSRKKRKK